MWVAARAAGASAPDVADGGGCVGDCTGGIAADPVQIFKLCVNLPSASVCTGRVSTGR